MVLPLLTGALPALAVTITSGAEQAPGDRARCLQCAYLVCKIVHRCTRSYMPSSLHAALSSSESGDRGGATPTLLALLGGIGASLRGKSNSNASGASELEGRLAKRIHVPLPDAAARVALLRARLAGENARSGGATSALGEERCPDPAAHRAAAEERARKNSERRAADRRDFFADPTRRPLLR